MEFKNKKNDFIEIKKKRWNLIIKRWISYRKQSEKRWNLKVKRWILLKTK